MDSKELVNISGAELAIKADMVHALMAMEYSPSVTELAEIKENSLPLSLEKLESIGSEIAPIVPGLFQGSGGTGIYRVVVEAGQKLTKFTDGSGFMGSSKLVGSTGSITSQARIQPLACNPYALAATAVITVINHKLDAIEHAAETIQEYLEIQNKAVLRGDVAILADILQNYQYNYNNETYRTNAHMKAVDIRQDSEQSLQRSQLLIESHLKKKEFLHIKKNVSDMLKKIRTEFGEYQLALYLYAYACFAEVLLLENFNSDYIQDRVEKIESYAEKYKNLYDTCYEQIKAYSDTSVESIAIKGVAGASRGIGSGVALLSEKLSVAGGKIAVSKVGEKKFGKNAGGILSGIGSKLGEAGEHMHSTGGIISEFGEKRTEDKMNTFDLPEGNSERPFVENLRMIDRMYNSPMGIFIDREAIYFLPMDN